MIVYTAVLDRRFTKCLFFVLIIAGICFGFEMYEKKLRDQLFHSSRHDNAVRPVVDPMQPVNVSFGIQLSKLVELVKY